MAIVKLSELEVIESTDITDNDMIMLLDSESNKCKCIKLSQLKNYINESIDS